MESVGVRWIRPDSTAGSSRKNGWEIMRRMLFNSVSREGPGLFVFDTCNQFIRTVPSIPRDDRDMDDVDTDTEDHVADEARYRALASPIKSGVAYVAGMF